MTAGLSGVAAYSLGSKLLTWGFLATQVVLPGLAIPTAVAMNAALNTTFTYRLGRECVRRFADPNFTSVDVITSADNWWRYRPGRRSATSNACS